MGHWRADLPFETPQIALTIVNFPAYVVAIPISNALKLPTTDWRNLICLPSILLLWYCVGRRIDFGLLPEKCKRLGAWLRILLLVVAIAAFLAGLYAFADSLKWWLEYGGPSVSQVLIFTRRNTPTPWCLLLG